MAVPDPPFLTPRIFKVLEPSAGHYEVVVKMDPSLASKFPEKPFGTAISAIGLAVKDSDKYPGYTLVSIEPADKGGKDHLWVFQKLDGPEWTTTSNSKENLTPAKFRSQTVVVKTEQEVDPDTQPNALTGDLVSSVVTQTPNTGKAVLTEITETIDENADPLVGQRAYVERVIGTVTETLVPELVETSPGSGVFTPSPVDSGHLIIDSQTTPLGNGKSIRETISVESWPVHTGSEWSDELETQIIRTEQYVEPPVTPEVVTEENPDPFAEPNTSYKIVNQDRSLKVVEVVPTEHLENYLLSFPTTEDLDLPNVLKSVAITWTNEKAVGSYSSNWVGSAGGESWSLSGSEGGDAHSSVSIRPDISPIIEQPWGKGIAASAHFFYIEMVNNTVTEEAFIARMDDLGLGEVLRWPMFRPTSHAIVTKGMKVGLTAKANGAASAALSPKSSMSDSSVGQGESSDISIVTSVTNISPTIHGVITLSGDTTKSSSVTAYANASWSGYGGFPSVNAQVGASAIATGSVYPTTLPATTPSEIPSTGTYVVKSKVEPYKWGWARCHAVLIDASNI